MPVHVRFRFNKVTGEVEEFLVDDQDRNLPEAEHDRIATAVGRSVIRSPRPIEVEPTGPEPPQQVTDPDQVPATADKLEVER